MVLLNKKPGFPIHPNLVPMFVEGEGGFPVCTGHREEVRDSLQTPEEVLRRGSIVPEKGFWNRYEFPRHFYGTITPGASKNGSVAMHPCT